MKNKINEALELDTIRMNALEASIATHMDYINHMAMSQKGYRKVLNDAISEQRDCNFNVDIEVRANAASIEEHSLKLLHTNDSHNAHMTMLSDNLNRLNKENQIAVTCEECGCAVLKEDATQGKSVIENYKEHELTMPEEKIRKVWYCKEHAPMK